MPWGNLSKAPTAAERDKWAQVSHEFLVSFAAQERDESEQRQKQGTMKDQRRKARQFLQALDHGHLTSTGVGLQHFVPEALTADAKLDIDRPNPSSTLSLSFDQGSVGWAASWHVRLHLKLALALHEDPSHRCHNGLQLAYKPTGLWAHMVLTSSACTNSVLGHSIQIQFWAIRWCSLAGAEQGSSRRVRLPWRTSG